MNDTKKSLNELLKLVLMQILAKSHSLLELKFFSIDYHILKCNISDFKVA